MPFNWPTSTTLARARAFPSSLNGPFWCVYVFFWCAHQFGIQGIADNGKPGVALSFLPACQHSPGIPTMALKRALRTTTTRPSLALAVAAWLALAATAGAAEPATDSMAQRMQACTGCHGREGRAASDGYYPRIAGKPQAYLFNQLINFRERRRGYAPMAHLVKNLTDDYLQEIAGHFSALDLPYPAPRPGPTSTEGLARGQALVQHGDKVRGVPACVACHGASMTGVLPAVPGLLGLPRDYINGQLGAWQSGLRRANAPDCMARVAALLKPQDIASVSMWLASQPVPADSKPAPPSAPTPSVAAPPAPCAGLAGKDDQR
jgi:cytochrome c553